MTTGLNFAYLVASLCFILTLQQMSSAKTARRGVLLGVIGMTAAVLGTALLHKDVQTYRWIGLGFVLGSVIGTAMSFIPMTKMPERIALSHCFGGLAAALVGIAEFMHHMDHPDRVTAGALGFEVYFGLITFTGSLMAFGKLQGFITGAPVTYPGQNVMNVTMFAAALVGLVWVIIDPTQLYVFLGIGLVGLLLGVLFVLPIGGADMPVVISLLNSYAGLAAAATGFALNNNVLIIAGALDGTSGVFLSIMMSKAMNRSFSNVLFGAFGTGGGEAALPAAGGAPALTNANINQATVDEAGELFKSAQSVIVVPGYGMAVSQAQHAVRELAQALENNGCTVRYAIHPVAGRMPGHMNVLLAEANVPYDQLFDLDDINDDFRQTDIALIVGANDIVNPAAKTSPSSPIYGMPVFNVEQARTVMVLKRGLGSGFSGIENDLFVQPNTVMVLGDARKTLSSIINELS